MSEIRYDDILGDYAVIATNRIRRPELYPVAKENLRGFKKCPFCKGNEHMTPSEIYRLEEGDSWCVRVVPNLYRALDIESENILKEDGAYKKMDGFGAHEIIIDSDEHIVDFTELSAKGMKNWLFVIKERVNDLRNDIRLNHFCIFKNQGKNSGATMPHIHTQLMALPLWPSRDISNLKRYDRFYKKEGYSIFEKVVDFEIAKGDRVISESKNFISFCPYASSFAFEVMIVPKISLRDIACLDEEMLTEEADILKSTLKGLKGSLGDFDFNLYIQNPPMQKNDQTEEFYDELNRSFRFYIRIIPRLYKIGGFELQSSMHINPVSPEEAAFALKKVIKELSV